MALAHWMAWEGGVDLVALTREGLSQPNLILHVARMVHTPVGSAPAGMVLYQPVPDEMPMVMGFVGACSQQGAYFGPHIFAGTPFEQAPALSAEITVTTSEGCACSRIEVAGQVFEVELSQLGPLELIDRAPGGMTPFSQRVMEAVAGSAKVFLDGQELPVLLPPVGLSGGAPAVFAPTGFYGR